MSLDRNYSIGLAIDSLYFVIDTNDLDVMSEDRIRYAIDLFKQLKKKKFKL